MRNLRGIESLRAVAALLVLVYHLSKGTGLTESGFLAPLAEELKSGVTVFFVISAFLLYRPFARAIRNGDPLPEWRAFGERRLIRILPAYWLAMALLSAGLAGVTLAPTPAWQLLSLTQVYSSQTMLGGLGVAWSLCVELSFYLCLPLLAYGLREVVQRRGSTRPAHVQLTVLAGLALGCLTLRVLLAGSLSAGVSPSHLVLATTLPGTFDWFAGGMALAIATESDSLWLRRLGARRWLCWSLALVALAVAAPFQQGDLFLSMYGLVAHVSLGLAAMFVVLPATVGAGGPSWRPLAWLGTVSYGIFLWHIPMLIVVQRWLSIPAHGASAPQILALGVVAAAAAAAAGAVSWYGLERPALRWVSGRRRVSVLHEVRPRLSVLD